jgi:hypothetical protein
VDGLLREALVADGWGLGGAVVTVRGAPGERVTQVIERLAALADVNIHPRAP